MLIAEDSELATLGQQHTHAGEQNPVAVRSLWRRQEQQRCYLCEVFDRGDV
jgi:hypothetical protein